MAAAPTGDIEASVSRTFIDYAERRAYIELAIKLMGIKPASDHLEELTLEMLIAESRGT